MVDIKIPRPDFEKDRGQIGVETLVVFIAMILVAALAAGVLINTAGFLQNKASSTSEDSQSQVSNQVRIIGAVGHVETGGPDDGVENNITSISLSVMQAPGAAEIDLAGATVRYISPNGATTLVYNQSTGTADSYKYDGADYNATFGVVGVKDNDNSVPVLNDQEDRFQINIDLVNASYNSTNDPGVGYVQALTSLNPGQEATLRVVAMSGAQTTYIANVPQSLSSTDDGEAVSL